MDRYDLHVILAEEEMTARLLACRDVPWTLTENPADPIEDIRQVAPDMDIDYLISCGWMHRIPKHIIDLPSQAALNCHSAYLPGYRGPVVWKPQWAHAELWGGASIHHLAEEFDNGKVVTRAQFQISLWDTPHDLKRKYSDITVPLLREALLLIEAGHDVSSHPGGGSYYSDVPTKTVLTHGIVNHLLRGIGLSWRWTIPSGSPS